METRFEILASSKEEDVEDGVEGLEVMARRQVGKGRKGAEKKKKGGGNQWVQNPM